MFHDYYEILGTDTESTQDEIKQAYRRRAREAHPDSHKGDKGIQTEEMMLINEAYSVLGDRRKRIEYDYTWKRHYKTKGEVRKRTRIGSDVAGETKLGVEDVIKPVTSPTEKSEPFWKDQRILIAVLVILVAVLLIDVAGTWIRRRNPDNPAIREMTHGYEFALGENFQHTASRRHLDQFRNLPEGAVEERRWHLERALALDPDNIEAAIAACPLLLELGRNEEAVNLTLRTLNHLENRTEQAGLTAEQLDQIITSQIDLMEVEYEALRRLERFGESRDVILALLELEPDNDRAVLDLAGLELRLGMSESAEDRLTQFLESTPDSPFTLDAKISLARSMMDQGRYDDAIEVAIETFAANPDNSELHLILGEAYYRLSDHASAIPHLHTALIESPDAIHVQLLLGDCYYTIGETSKAIGFYTGVISQNPSNFEARMGLGNCYYSLGRLEEARNEYYQAVQIRPNSQEARNALERIPRSE